MEGRVLKGRYRLMKMLGRGGMGTVWSAKDLTLHIDVAVKLIEPAQAESLNVRARFEREALAAAQLRSLHIVLITDHGVDGDTPYIVMELLRGMTLAAHLKQRSRLSFEVMITWLSQVASALSIAHEKRIVHRDLKPENIFIVPERETEVVKVLDFGVAKQLDQQSFGDPIKTNTGALLGTPHYMSPEQARGMASVDHRTDIWSFGVIAYECLTGLRPFRADTLPDLLMSICHQPVTAPSELAPVPLGFDHWFAKAAAREVNDRFSSIEEAMSALMAIRGPRSVLPGPTEPRRLRIDPHPGEPRSGYLSSISCMPSTTSANPPHYRTARPRRRVFLWALVPFVGVLGVLVPWAWHRLLPRQTVSVQPLPAAINHSSATVPVGVVAPSGGTTPNEVIGSEPRARATGGSSSLTLHTQRSQPSAAAEARSVPNRKNRAQAKAALPVPPIAFDPPM